MNNSILSRQYKALSGVAYATPLAVLFGINFSSYVSTPGAGLSFFGYILAVFAVFGAKGKIAAAAQKNTVLTVSAVVFGIALVMQYLATELLLISGASLFGSIASVPFENVAKVYAKNKGMLKIPQKTAWKASLGFPAVGVKNEL